MASTACRACWAVVPDKMGRQRLTALASSSFVIRPVPVRSPRKPAPGAETSCATSLTPPPCTPCRGVFLRRRPCDPPTWKVDQATHIHVRCLIPSTRNFLPVLRVRVTGSPYHAFGLAAARRLGVRAAVWSALRRRVGAALVAADDLRQVLLVERAQGFLRQFQLLLGLHGSLRLWEELSDGRAASVTTSIVLTPFVAAFGRDRLSSCRAAPRTTRP